MSESKSSQEEFEHPLLAIPEIRAKFEQFIKLDKKELAIELAYLKAALEKVDDYTRYIIENMFMPCRIVLRNYQGRYGILMGAHFMPEEYIILEDVEFKEYIKNVLVHERKTTRIHRSAALMFEIIHFSEEKPAPEE